MRRVSSVALVLATACGTTRSAPSTAPADAASEGAEAMDGGSTPTTDAGSIEPTDADSAEAADAPSIDGGCPACSGTCAGNRCLIILGAGQGAVHVVVDGTNAYWVTFGGPAGASVVKAPLGGGTPITLVVEQGNAYGIALAGGNVYWSAEPPFPNDGGAILSIAVDGGTVTTIATPVSLPGDLAVDSANVYWAASGNVAKAPIRGGPITTLVSGVTPQVMTIDETSVYFTTNAGNTGKVMRVPKSGGTPQTLAFEVTNEQGIAVDQSNVYWTNTAGDVMRTAVDGGPLVPIAFLQADPVSVAVDSTSVYWANSGPPGSVVKAPLDGGALTTIASGLQYPDGIAVDATSVYFTSGGNVVRVTPK
jgi:hypothetical protein